MWSAQAVGGPGIRIKEAPNVVAKPRIDEPTTRSIVENEAGLPENARTAEAQLRADTEALMARLIQIEQALLDSRQQVAAVPRAAAPLVDTRNHWQSTDVQW